MLRRAVNCFLDQTYEPRELIVVHRSDDSATRNYLDGLQQALIRTVELPVRPKISLGELRNIAIQASRGRYIATWDDDDWHSPLRLAGQIELMRASGKSACLLMRLVLFDQLTQQSYLSGPRLWEASLVAERHVLGRYPDPVEMFVEQCLLLVGSEVPPVRDAPVMIVRDEIVEILLEVRSGAANCVDLVLADHFREREADLGSAHGPTHGEKQPPARVEQGLPTACRIEYGSGIEMPKVAFEILGDGTGHGFLSFQNRYIRTFRSGRLPALFSADLR